MIGAAVRGVPIALVAVLGIVAFQANSKAANSAKLVAELRAERSTLIGKNQILQASIKQMKLSVEAAHSARSDVEQQLAEIDQIVKELNDGIPEDETSAPSTVRLIERLRDRELESARTNNGDEN